MTMLTVNIENKKTEKAVKVILDAFGLNYSIEQDADPTKRPLNKAEEVRYKRLKSSFEQIKLHKEGKIKLQTIEELLAELS